MSDEKLGTCKEVCGSSFFFWIRKQRLRHILPIIASADLYCEQLIIVRMSAAEGEIPKIAILGSGIFARTQYIPRLREIADLVDVKTIWSRTEDSAKAAAELARDFCPNIEFKWGDAGLDDIILDDSIHGVAIVLAGQIQVDMSLKMLKAGKHVIQDLSGLASFYCLIGGYDGFEEKPACGSTSEAETALSSYKSLCNHLPHQPIWAVAENYRFEPAFVECRKLINDIGEMMNIQVIVESSMNSSNPYFSSSWRRNFNGGFILDMGVHFIAGLRMLVGCEIATVSAIARHVDTNLPPPDNLCSLFQLENGCAGVFVMAVSSPSPKIYWRVDGTKGTLQIERGIENGRHGYTVLFNTTDGLCERAFHPFSGVHEELKAFVHDIKQATNKYTTTRPEAEPRSSYLEGVRDVAVLEAMLESSSKNGALTHVKRF